MVKRTSFIQSCSAPGGEGNHNIKIQVKCQHQKEEEEEEEGDVCVKGSSPMRSRGEVDG